MAGGEGVGLAVDVVTSVYLTGNGTEDFTTTPGAYTHPSGTLFVMKLAADSPGSGGPEPVAWTSAANVAVDGNTITKTAGCSGCADAGAISGQTIEAGDGFVEFTVPAGAIMTVGLSSGNPGTSGSEIKFGRDHVRAAVLVELRGGAGERRLQGRTGASWQTPSTRWQSKAGW